MAKYPLTFSDVEGIKKAKAILDELEKAGKLPEGPVKWVGSHGFNTCVAHLTGKKGIDNPKAICGAMKGKAHERGQLKPKYMGRIQKKEYLAKKRTQKTDFENELEKQITFDKPISPGQMSSSEIKNMAKKDAATRRPRYTTGDNTMGPGTRLKGVGRGHGYHKKRPWSPVIGLQHAVPPAD